MLAEEPPRSFPREGPLAVTGGTHSVRSRYPKGSLVLPFGLLIALSALGASGCSDATSALQQDVAQLRQDLNALTLAVHRGRGDSETVVGQVDRRTREQSTEQGRQLTALS